MCVGVEGVPHLKGNANNIYPVTPTFQVYILPTFWRDMYKWCSENW